MADFLVKQGHEIAGSQLVSASTKADKTDLTNIIQTGTASSQAISTGTYFYLNGTLVRAKTAIANGATFTLNTNYEVVTAGALDAIEETEVSISSGNVGTFNTVNLPNGFTKDNCTIVGVKHEDNVHGTFLWDISAQTLGIFFYISSTLLALYVNTSSCANESYTVILRKYK